MGLTCHASHNTADVLCDFEQMCDCQGVQELVLRNTPDISNRRRNNNKKSITDTTIMATRDLTKCFVNKKAYDCVHSDIY